jgi:membrane protein DedA with SNARE-associated domain
MSFTYTLSPILLVSILLITSLSLFMVTNYNLLLLLSSILVSSTKVNTPGVVIGAILGGILSAIYRNYSSNYVTKPYRKYYSRLINGLGI